MFQVICITGLKVISLVENTWISAQESVPQNSQSREEIVNQVSAPF